MPAFFFFFFFFFLKTLLVEVWFNAGPRLTKKSNLLTRGDERLSLNYNLEGQQVDGH